MTKEVIEVPFEGVAVRKLHDLFERGYTVCGVAIQRIHQSGNFDRGAITTNGMVMWWQKLFSGDELEASNVQHPSNALQLAEALHEMANTYLPTGGDFVPAPRSKADELMDDAAAILRSQHARIAELEAENSGLRILASGGIELFERYSTFKAKCEELEAMLDAVGAGGVGQSIRPSAIDAIRLAEATFRAYGDHHAAKPDDEKAQRNYQLAEQMRAALLAAVPDAPQPLEQPPAAQQEPVAWLVCSTNPDGSLKVEHAATWKEAAHEHINDAIVEYEVSEAGSWIVQPAYTAPQPTENLKCKSTQKRLATLWGYEKPQHRQPLTNEQIIAIADNARAAESGDAGYILPIAFARAIEAAIAKQPDRQPLTEDQLRDALRQCPHDTTENLRVRWLYAKDFARSIEAAHGITGSQQ